MRKKTVPRAQKQNKASSSAKLKGLIANDHKSRQSAVTESILDNRSHRVGRTRRSIDPRTLLLRWAPLHVDPAENLREAVRR